MKVPVLEKKLGMKSYATQSPGIGGRIRQYIEDFVVEEFLVDGSKAEISQGQTQELYGKGRYLICVLVKRDWDTLLVVRKIARRLGISARELFQTQYKVGLHVASRFLCNCSFARIHETSRRNRRKFLTPCFFARTTRWFVFWAGTIMLIGVSLVSRAIILAAAMHT
ncbi:MAG: tRNA pseudouridine(13) synthase TruD [Candidatus Bathyarchaeota archaeon]|nr:MAG: tRNA pseudouridine(13) synthase TruD [Candidatus Bathyarchaeota archaeon]